jgi:hypothetical protein
MLKGRGLMIDRCRAAGLCLAALLGACSPVIRVEAPDKPIEINLNVRVEQDVKVQVDRELQKVVGKNPAAPP